MCGFIGIYGYSNVVSELYDGLLLIQHRGQDSAGIVTYDSKFHTKKKSGLVRDVFKTKSISRLEGYIGLGHVRYPTVGGGKGEDAQPFILNHPFGIAMAHNGNVTNYAQLKKELSAHNLRHINSGCDVEIILNVLADELAKQDPKELDFQHICTAVKQVFNRVKGSYSVVAMLAEQGMVAFRDPHGIKPIIMGEKSKGDLKSFCIASESLVLDILDYHNTHNIQPGEVVFIDTKRQVHKKQLVEKTHYPCIFEWIYFARPDSFIDKISVYKTRLRLGKALAEEWKKTGLKADVIVPVPDSARSAAVQMAKELGIEYREALVKNRYVGRTFIMPGQKERKRSIKQKLNAIRVELEGKDVLLVDDSIVRGNTSKQIVEMVRKAGANKVYFASYSSPLKYPCIYGIDMSTKGEFIATNLDSKQIAEKIGADYVLYQDIDSMKQCAHQGNPNIKNFCAACFDSKYPTGDVTDEMLDAIENDRLNNGQ